MSRPATLPDARLRLAAERVLKACEPVNRPGVSPELYPPFHLTKWLPEELDEARGALMDLEKALRGRP